jgi:hypothetical protein
MRALAGVPELLRCGPNVQQAVSSKRSSSACGVGRGKGVARRVCERNTHTIISRPRGVCHNCSIARSESL